MPYTCGNCGTDLTQYVIPKQGQVGTLIHEGFIPGAPAPAPAAPFESVVVKCVNVPGCGKSNAFEIAAKSDQDTVRGRLLDKEEEDLFAQLRGYFDPKSTAERINKYALWLFGGTAILSPVLSLFTSVIPYTFAGKVLLALAVLSLVVSMVFATRASSLTSQSANPNNLQAMLAKVTERRTEQGSQLKWAAWCFAGALGLIGLIPLVNMFISDSKHPRLQASYTRSAKNLTATLVASGLEPLDLIELELETQGAPKVVLGRSHAVAGDNGQAQLTLTLEPTELRQPLVMTSRRLRDGKKEDEKAIEIPIPVPAPAAPTPAPTPAEHVRYILQDGKLSLSVVTAHLDAPRTYVLDVSQKGSATRVLARSRVVLDAASPTAELKVEKVIDLSQGALSLVVARDEKGKLVSLFEQQLTDKATELFSAQANNK